MANFGFERLSVVSPYKAHWREARSAIGAPDLLQNARETASLAEAIADCTLVVGTGTLTARKPEQQTASLPSLALPIQSELERGGRIALVFGPEKRGLTRDDLSHCHLLVEIPTNQRQPSMNLGQAVAVCLYELATRFSRPDQISVEMRRETNVTAQTLDLLGEVIEKTMTAAGYSPPDMEAANRHDLRLLLRRLNLNVADAKRALGIFRRILWRLERQRP